MTSNPATAGVAVHIAYGEDRDATTATFQGNVTEVRQHIAEFFGMRDDPSALTLSDLVVNASAQARGVGTVARQLGGTVITSAAHPSTTATPGDADAWAQAANPSQGATPPANPLLTAIEQAPDVEALKRLWAQNRDAFTDPAVMDAWKTRGRQLT